MKDEYVTVLHNTLKFVQYDNMISIILFYWKWMHNLSTVLNEKQPIAAHKNNQNKRLKIEKYN